MSRTFAYVRISTTGQTTENQIQEIEAAGFKVDPRRVVSETVSGSSAIEQRLGFIKLLNKLEQDDVLIVTKLDRLGRNAIDVATTVARLAAMEVRVHCLALGGVDLHKPRRSHDDRRHQLGRAAQAGPADRAEIKAQTSALDCNEKVA
jgi:putative DNA-invertase from lambdoid prophage Rac